MAAVAPSPACVDAARLAAMVLGIESELSQAIAAANSTRANVLATRDSCRKSFAEYSATSAKLTVVKDMHWKLAREHDLLLRQVKENRAWLSKEHAAHAVIHDRIVELGELVAARKLEHAAQVAEARALGDAETDAAAVLALTEQAASAEASAIATLALAMATQQEAVQAVLSRESHARHTAQGLALEAAGLRAALATLAAALPAVEESAAAAERARDEASAGLQRLSLLRIAAERSAGTRGEQEREATAATQRLRAEAGAVQASVTAAEDAATAAGASLAAVVGELATLTAAVADARAAAAHAQSRAAAALTERDALGAAVRAASEELGAAQLSTRLANSGGAVAQTEGVHLASRLHALRAGASVAGCPGLSQRCAGAAAAAASVASHTAASPQAAPLLATPAGGEAATPAGRPPASSPALPGAPARMRQPQMSDAEEGGGCEPLAAPLLLSLLLSASGSDSHTPQGGLEEGAGQRVAASPSQPPSHSAAGCDRSAVSGGRGGGSSSTGCGIPLRAVRPAAEQRLAGGSSRASPLRLSQDSAPLATGAAADPGPTPMSSQGSHVAAWGVVKPPSLAAAVPQLQTPTGGEPPSLPPPPPCAPPSKLPPPRISRLQLSSVLPRPPAPPPPRSDDVGGSLARGPPPRAGGTPAAAPPVASERDCVSGDGVGTGGATHRVLVGDGSIRVAVQRFRHPAVTALAASGTAAAVTSAGRASRWPHGAALPVPAKAAANCPPAASAAPPSRIAGTKRFFVDLCSETAT